MVDEILTEEPLIAMEEKSEQEGTYGTKVRCWWKLVPNNLQKTSNFPCDTYETTKIKVTCTRMASPK